MSQPEYFAAIDLGSNSFHLVIVRALKGDLQTLFRHKERVRLASGLNDDNRLSQEAIKRGVEVLNVFAEQIKSLPNCRVMAVATHTLRVAINRREFLSAASTVFPYPIDIISGQEEARLIYHGVAHDEQLEGNTLVIDIGGGSSEIVVGTGTNVLLARSHQMGCVSFTHQFFSNGISSSQYAIAKLEARQRLERFEAIFKHIGWQHVRITSGTAQAIVSAAQALDESFQSLTLDHICSIKAQLFNNPDHAIFNELTPERLGVLAAGLAIMEAIYEALAITDSSFSTSALREGLLHEALEVDENLSVRGNSCHSLMQRYHVDEQQAQRVATTASEFWHAARDTWQLPNDSLKFLQFAAQLHEIGLNINASGLHKHSAYIVTHSNLPGFSFEQQQLVASLIRQHRKRIRPDLLSELQWVDINTQQKLIMILRLAVIWHLNRNPSPPPLPALEFNESGVQVRLQRKVFEPYPLLVADLTREVALCEASPEWPILALDFHD